MRVLGSSPKSILESMELVRLPSPPHILVKLLDVCHDPASSIEDLTDVVSTDAALTSKLLIAVNSAAFSLRQPISNLKHAITLLGHNLLKTMAITSSIQQLFSGLTHSRSEFICDVWLDSLYCAVFAQDIAHVLNYDYPEDAYLAGLLHDFGQIVFDAKFHKQYSKIIDSETELETIQKEVLEFGISHAELGACIIEQWPSLSPAIADAARFHHEGKEQLKESDILCQIVAEASQIAWHWSHFGVADDNWHSELIDDKKLQEIYIQVQHKVSQTASSLGIPLPETGSLTQSELSKNLEKENIILAQKVRDTSLVNAINSEGSPSLTVNSPRTLLLKIAQEMQVLFSINDVALLIADSEDADFLTLYEIDHIHPVSKFSVNNNNSQMIRSFIEKRNYWIETANNDEKTSSIMDRQIIRKLNHENVLSFPLAHGKQILGTIIIGSNNAQKIYLKSQSGIISSYLKSITADYLKNIQMLQQQTSENEAQKEKEQKNIERLVHEISNPLSVIGNYIDIIKRNSKTEDEEDNKEIHILKEELQRIRNIVLNFNNEPKPETHILYLNDELKICIPLYAKSLNNDREVIINWSLDESDSEINISRDALRQIVLNLIKNAVEAQVDDVVISVTSHHFVNINGLCFAQFIISDQGNGVDAATRQRLFSPLTSIKEGANRGMGLAVVAELLNSFSGQIKYLENKLGGASFEVLIPLHLKT